MFICHMHQLGNAILLLLMVLLLMNGAQQSEYGWLPVLMPYRMPYRVPFKTLCCAVLWCACPGVYVFRGLALGLHMHNHIRRAGSQQL